MSRPPKPVLPLRDGVGASAVFCPPGPWTTLSAFLAERLPMVDNWALRIARDEVVNETGRPVAEAYVANRRVFYWRRLDAEPEVPFEARIVFRDEHLLVADKPHFLPVTPGGAYVQQTLLTRLRRATGLAELSPIHRLDRETAGLVVFSLRAAERGAYQNLFRDRAVDKVYEAVAPAGAGPWPRVLRHRLVEREGEAFMQMQAVDGEPNAETWVDLVESVGAGLARYQLRPRSGVKHQLRAQMNALGLPIAGDRIYPRLQPQEHPPRFDAPLQLVARVIAFTDPVTGQPRRFERAALTIAPS
ncbi:pseudouridine synthase [Roseateles sp.]|uniref:pseudouridine synthase n=1 Tax=Roseateles sp. TaxID=1971397 RepID=UPI0025D1089A|nr:pseudouridine synthase [Roseateles sp.]